MKRAVTFDTVRKVARKFPAVEDGSSYGTAALKVKSKLLARLKEDGDSVAPRPALSPRRAHGTEQHPGRGEGDVAWRQRGGQAESMSYVSLRDRLT
jgi:hypothetical protein